MNKPVLILGMVFLVLVGVYFMTSYHPSEVTSGAEALFPEGFRPDIDRIRLYDVYQGEVILQRQSDGWYLENPLQYKAYDDAVQNLIQTLLTTKIDNNEVSTREDAQNQFMVGDSTGTRMTVYSGDREIIDVIVGRQSQQLGHTYARMVGSDQIQLWRGMLSQYATQNITDWRDRRLYSYNEQDITSITVAGTGISRSLTMQDTTWVYTENGEELPVDQMLVRNVVYTIGTLTADAFGDENDIPRVASSDPNLRVTFRVRNGDENVYDVWLPTQDATSYLVRKLNGDVVFRFYAYRGEQLVLDYTRMQSGTAQ